MTTLALKYACTTLQCAAPGNPDAARISNFTPKGSKC